MEISKKKQVLLLMSWLLEKRYFDIKQLQAIAPIDHIEGMTYDNDKINQIIMGLGIGRPISDMGLDGWQNDNGKLGTLVQKQLVEEL